MYTCYSELKCMSVTVEVSECALVTVDESVYLLQWK